MECSFSTDWLSVKDRSWPSFETPAKSFASTGGAWTKSRKSPLIISSISLGDEDSFSRNATNFDSISESKSSSAAALMCRSLMTISRFDPGCGVSGIVHPTRLRTSLRRDAADYAPRNAVVNNTWYRLGTDVVGTDIAQISARETAQTPRAKRF